MTVQAARPAFNTTYDSPLLNFMDDAITFKYQEFQPIEFNENKVQGNDPLVANLTAVLAYYVNIILGFDYDSYSLRAGIFPESWYCQYARQPISVAGPEGCNGTAENTTTVLP
jgi:hypothetical protein